MSDKTPASNNAAQKRMWDEIAVELDIIDTRVSGGKQKGSDKRVGGLLNQNPKDEVSQLLAKTVERVKDNVQAIRDNGGNPRREQLYYFQQDMHLIEEIIARKTGDYKKPEPYVDPAILGRDKPFPEGGDKVRTEQFLRLAESGGLKRLSTPELNNIHHAFFRTFKEIGVDLDDRTVGRLRKSQLDSYNLGKSAPYISAYKPNQIVNGPEGPSFHGTPNITDNLPDDKPQRLPPMDLNAPGKWQQQAAQHLKQVEAKPLQPTPDTPRFRPKHPDDVFMESIRKESRTGARDNIERIKIHLENIQRTIAPSQKMSLLSGLQDAVFAAIDPFTKQSSALASNIGVRAPQTQAQPVAPSTPSLPS